MWINTADNQVFTTHSAIRANHPNVSFPSEITDEILYSFGYEPITQTDPSYDPVTQSAVELAPTLTTDGEWVQTWAVAELFTTQEERDAAIAADTEAKHLAAIAGIVAAMEALFDATAQSRRYDNRITCALRAGYAGPFQAEGLAFATWMDASNAAAYQMLAEVQAGTMAMPATTAEALSLLPEMVWP